MTEDIAITLEIPAANTFMSVISACIEETLVHVGIAEQQERYNVQLALHEIAVNIVNHAYEGIPNGRIRLSLAFDRADARLMIELLDTGAVFDPSAVQPPDLESLPENGLGLMLAESLLDRVEYARVGNTNRWRLLKTFK